MPSMAQQVQQAQMRAFQSAPQGYYANPMYPSPYGAPQAMPGAAPYNPYAQQGVVPQSQGGQFDFSQGSKGSNNKGFGKGRGKGKGKGFTKGAFSDARDSQSAGRADDDPKRAIEIAQRRAKQRDREAIIQAQQSALKRFEKDHLERLQGRWYDSKEANVTYTLEGSMLSVESGANARIFKNRLSIFNGDICWDARRFWHKLNVDKDLPPVGEKVESVTWTPGEGSGSTKPIVWQRTPPEIPTAPAEA